MSITILIWTFYNENNLIKRISLLVFLVLWNKVTGINIHQKYLRNLFNYLVLFTTYLSTIIPIWRDIFRWKAGKPRFVAISRLMKRKSHVYLLLRDHQHHPYKLRLPIGMSKINIIENISREHLGIYFSSIWSSNNILYLKFIYIYWKLSRNSRCTRVTFQKQMFVF